MLPILAFLRSTAGNRETDDVEFEGCSQKRTFGCQSGCSVMSSPACQRIQRSYWASPRLFYTDPFRLDR